MVVLDTPLESNPGRIKSEKPCSPCHNELIAQAKIDASLADLPLRINQRSYDERPLLQVRNDLCSRQSCQRRDLIFVGSARALRPRISFSIQAISMA